MKKRDYVLWFLGALWLVALVPGCTVYPNRLQFADNMGKSTRKLKLLAIEFRAAIEGALNPALATPTTPAVRTVFAKVQDTIKELKAEKANLRKPLKPSASLPELAEAYQAYIDVEETIANTHYKQIVEILEDPQTPANVKGKLIKDELTAARKLETEALVRVKAAAQEYAKEHKLAFVAEKKAEF